MFDIKIKFSVFLLISFLQSNAQKVLEIDYRQTYLDGSTEITRTFASGNIMTSGIGDWKIKMIVNDTFGMIFYFRPGKDPLKRKKTIGDKLIHHSSFLDFINQVYYDESDYPKGNKYLIIRPDTMYKNWQFLKNEKNILGYKCSMALSVNYKNDSTIVWFTNDLPYKNGFLFYEGVPGVVLESQLLKGIGLRYIANKIRERDIQIVFPLEGEKITAKDFQTRKEAKNE